MRGDYGRKMSADRRVVDNIRRNPAMIAEQQGSKMVEDWGSLGNYSYWARQPMPERVTFVAVNEGFTTAGDIASATGLTIAEVSDALSKLEVKGHVEPGVITK